MKQKRRDKRINGKMQEGSGGEEGRKEGRKEVICCEDKEEERKEVVKKEIVKHVFCFS